MKRQDPDRLPSAINKAYRLDRSVDELLGLCKGILADAMVVQKEVQFLLRWFRLNEDALDNPLARMLHSRIYEALKDNHLDQEEKEEILQLIKDFTGEHSGNLDTRLSCNSCFTKPEPAVVFSCMNYCLTGRFAFGSRKEVTEEILNQGGWVHDTVTNSTNFLIVGTFASRDWAHGNFGRKIQSALHKIDKGQQLAIISEDHWASYLLPPA